jgi:hypothetical protein
MSKLSAAAIMTSMLALAFNPANIQHKEFRFSHKERVKRDIQERIIKPGRNHPANGYDPITKTWVKP